jgi:hypothetical protein
MLATGLSFLLELFLVCVVLALVVFVGVGDETQKIFVGA